METGHVWQVFFTRTYTGSLKRSVVATLIGCAQLGELMHSLQRQPLSRRPYRALPRRACQTYVGHNEPS